MKYNTTTEIVNQVMADLNLSKPHIDKQNLDIFSLTTKVSRVVYKKGTIIVNEGENFDRFFFLAKGFLKVFRDVNDKRIFVRMIKPGEFIGLTLFSNIISYPFSLIALEETVVYFIDKEILREDIFNNPSIMKWVISDLSHIIAELYKKIVYLSSKHMNGRLAEALLYFADDIFRENVFLMPITKKQLGHFTNISPENVTRILKSLEKENVLKIDKKKIIILDHNKLEQISKLG